MIILRNCLLEHVSLQTCVSWKANFPATYSYLPFTSGEFASWSGLVCGDVRPFVCVSQSHLLFSPFLTSCKLQISTSNELGSWCEERERVGGRKGEIERERKVIRRWKMIKLKDCGHFLAECIGDSEGDYSEKVGGCFLKAFSFVLVIHCSPRCLICRLQSLLFPHFSWYLSKMY